MRDGHDAGFTELYLRHHGVARRVAATYRYRRDPDDLVNEAFEKVFAALRRGSGPTGSFRAYLLVTLRRLAGERGDRRDEQPVDDVPEPVAAAARGPSLAAEERQLINRAFESLPERSQAVLWYTAVEGRHPRELSDRLGMTANAVSALAYRAREQLRQAYLQAHLQTLARPQCAPHRSGLGAYVRGGQSRRDRQRTEHHMARCPYCRNLVDELHEVNRMLVRAVTPIFLAATGALGDAVAGAATGAAAGGTGAAAGGAGAAGGGSGAAAGAAGGGGAAEAGATEAVRAAAGRAGEVAVSGGDTVRRLPGALAWLKGAAPSAGGVAAAAAIVGGLAATGTLVFRHDPGAQPDAVGAAAPPSAGPPATTAAPPPAAAGGPDAGTVVPAAIPCRPPGEADQTAISPSDGSGGAPPAPATSPTTTPPPARTGVSLRLPLVGDVELPSLVEPLDELAAPLVTLQDPVCSVGPDEGRGELTVALAGAGAGAGAAAVEPAPQQTTASTAPPLVDLDAAGLELTIELSDGALAVDAELPVGCDLLDEGHTVRCALDASSLTGDATTLDLQLLSESELATVSLHYGDQTLDVRAVELLREVTEAVVPAPPVPAESPESPESPESSEASSSEVGGSAAPAESGGVLSSPLSPEAPVSSPLLP